MMRAPFLILSFPALVALPTVLHAQPPVVRSSAPVWGAAPRLVEELRIGVFDGEDEYMFGNVYAAAVGANGTTLVGDHQMNVVRMFDAKGKFVKNVGRTGEGPGEYRSIGGVGVAPDGRIVVWDNHIQRLTTFSASGVYESGARVPSGLFSSDVLRMGTDGTRYVKTVVAHDLPTGDWRYGWIRVSSAGVVLDTIIEPDDVMYQPSFVLSTPSGYDRPFHRALVKNMTGTGAVAVGLNVPNGPVYTFELRKPGAPTVRIEHPFVAIPISGVERREWDAWIERVNRDRRTLPTHNHIVPQSRQQAARTVSLPSHKPAFSEFRSDSDGRIWVRRYTTAVARPVPQDAQRNDRPVRTMFEPQTFDVFEHSGRFLGTVTLPMRTNLLDAKGMTVLAVQEGKLGENVVVRFRIVR